MIYRLIPSSRGASFGILVFPFMMVACASDNDPVFGKDAGATTQAPTEAGVPTCFAENESHPAYQDPSSVEVTPDVVDPANAGVAGQSVGPYSQPLAISKPYRGFNLTGMYKKAWGMGNGYSEADFKLLHDIGFNYVRLPLDYMTYCAATDWLTFNLNGLKKIDQAVTFGQQYGVHVNLNLHQAPGYSVSMTGIPTSQNLDLWTSSEAQQVFVAHWEMFANRYKNIPAEFLSFNLVNEPPTTDTSQTPHVTENAYVNVLQMAINAIRAVSPDRPVVVDGLNGGRIPVKLADKSIIQSVHNYEPWHLTGYKAPFYAGSGSMTWPEPQWPPFMAPRFFWGPVHSGSFCQLNIVGICPPMTLQGSFPAGTEVSLTVSQASFDCKGKSATQLKFRTENQVLIDQTFNVDSPAYSPANTNPLPANSSPTSTPSCSSFQPTYDNLKLTAVLPAEARRLALEITKGDWVVIDEIDVTFPADSGRTVLRLVPAIDRWDTPQTTYTVSDTDNVSIDTVPPGYEQTFDPLGWLDDWVSLRKSGVSVVVGEWGVYNQTSQDVTLAWLKDQLAAYSQAGFDGWALWDQPDGPWGIFGTPRPGSIREPIPEAQCRLGNRQMLDLLKQY